MFSTIVADYLTACLIVGLLANSLADGHQLESTETRNEFEYNTWRRDTTERCKQHATTKQIIRLIVVVYRPRLQLIMFVTRKLDIFIASDLSKSHARSGQCVCCFLVAVKNLPTPRGQYGRIAWPRRLNERTSEDTN